MNPRLTQIKIIALLILFLCAGLFLLHTYKVAPIEHPQMESTRCWFGKLSQNYKTECYWITLPENHASPTTNTVKIPLAIFRNTTSTSKAPVLHLGAGGPGAPMYLNENYVVDYLIDSHDDFSLKNGRDFYVIDPRGAGLSSPRLVCQHFVDNLPARLAQHLSIKEEWQKVDADYLQCIEDFMQRNINFAHYNSQSVVWDIEALRQILGIPTWSLIGVSYGAVYAQMLAHYYPDTVESMILDSAAFPNLKMDNRYVERSYAPYKALYNYCDADPECEAPLPNLQTRLWALYDSLQHSPITLFLDHPYKESDILEVRLTGERFIGSLMEGIYSEEVFYQLPQIIRDMENSDYSSVQPFLEDHLAFLLDDTYGDLSASAHYCFEDKPFINYENLLPLIEQFSEPQLRYTFGLSLTWQDYCEKMGIPSAPPEFAQALNTDIPTLFLHGKLDTVTPLEDVQAMQANFSRSEIRAYHLSHGILGVEPNAENDVKHFLDSLSPAQ